ncbi:MAG: dihydroorotate dehydrogenase electron transfer subunit [Candidatus Zixiibacteriota bacterium]|nr:MAG: dihydroorotate dehydrogenase electron transfer subunit [candidate division Zixibacteria bacterium]
MLAQLSCTVLSRKELLDHIFKLTLSSSHISRKAKPGNFVHLKVNSDAPLLRRPFSIHSVDRARNRFEILLKVVGKGSAVLSQKSPGETLDLLGPIGNSFSLPPRGREVILVAGGMGIAPLWFLLTRLAGRFSPEDMTVFMGAKSKTELLYADKLKGTQAKLIVATDDGSAGRKGLITEVFLKEIKKRGRDLKKLAVCSCGPHKMLKSMSEIAKSLDLWCQISLETHMACGVGACWGCVVKGNDGTYKRVCVDGPVFDAREVVLE